MLVIHYTAAGSLEGTVSWFRQTRARASAHVVIGRDGAVVQMVPFDQIAWHAGTSSWRGRSGLNRSSLGIELCNWGLLETANDNVARTWTGHNLDPDKARRARHKHQAHEHLWEAFPNAQIERALEVGATIAERYGLSEVVGHDDIAPTRKLDPGPLFPMAEYRNKLFGDASNHAALAYVAVGHLNIRTGPGLTFDRLDEGPLTLGTAVEFLEASGPWRLVNVQDGQGKSYLTGWVHSAYLESA